jgi:WD40 repeat protein
MKPLCHFKSSKFIFYLNEKNKSLDDNWHVVKFPAHSIGVNSVSWAPSKDHMRFVSAGSDNLIKIWKIKENNHGYDIDSIYTESTLEAHEDVARDVSWRPSKDSNYDIIASGGDVQSINFNNRIKSHYYGLLKIKEIISNLIKLKIIHTIGKN